MGVGEMMTAIAGSAVLFGAVAWLARSIIIHFPSKDLENFKLNLQRESQQELLRLQSSLQLFEFEHQVRFSRLHERRAEIISEIYRKVVELYRTAFTFVTYYQGCAKPNKEELLSRLWKAADEFKDYFESHRIYFTQDTCSIIDRLNEALSNACSNLATSVHDRSVIQVSSDQIWKEWKEL